MPVVLPPVHPPAVFVAYLGIDDRMAGTGTLVYMAGALVRCRNVAVMYWSCRPVGCDFARAARSARTLHQSETV